MRCPWTSVSSSEPPPRSPTMPSGLWKPDTTPSALSSASRLPETSAILVPHTRSASAMKALPLLASRHAAVASTWSCGTSMRSHSTRNRRSAPSALSTASAAKSPVECTSRPSPASTFSLKIGVGLRVSPSYTTKRTEFEPISMTAIGGPWSSRPCAGSSSASRCRLASIKPTDEAARRRFFERFATSRQARIGHEIFVSIEGFLSLRGFYAIRGAVGQEFPALLVVLEVGHHDLLEHLLVHG